MKAEIEVDGRLVLIPENSTEAYAAMEWNKKRNKKNDGARKPTHPAIIVDVTEFPPEVF